MSIIFNSAGIAETMNNGVSNVTGADSIITENYTNVVQHGIKIDMSVSEKTLSGTPPLSFNSNGAPLLDYLISGNMVQSGTPQGCGDRTENLFDKSTVENGKGIATDGSIVNNAKRCSTITPIDVSTYSNVVISFTATLARAQVIYALFDDSTLVTRQTAIFSGTTIDVSSGNKLYICFYDPGDIETIQKSDLSNVMLNTGSTALPYEPYGYKIPVSVSGRIYNVYIGNSPLRKAIDSSNAVDTINYGTQQLIRRVDSNGTALSEPVTETIEVPQIATIDGINVINVQTTLKPSNISITYKGR